MGYGEDQFGFQLWDPIAKKIVWSIDVVFNETKVPDLQSTSQEVPTKEFIPMSLFNENNYSLNP